MTNGHSPREPIRLGIVGTGIFARDAHLPALRMLSDTFQVVAVCSRRPESAATFAGLLPSSVAVYPDLPALLAEADVDALDVVVPPNEMPRALEISLASGKHVFSEKPISPDVRSGRTLLAVHARHPGSVWMVGENWRYEATFIRAAKIVAAGEIGRPLYCHWADHFHVTPTNKYYSTTWRQSGTVPGGYLLDSGIHRVAALRMIVGEVAEVCALGAQLRPDLPPLDTQCAALRFQNGVIGSYSLTVATSLPVPTLLTVVGTAGHLQVDRRGVQILAGERRESWPVVDYSDLPAIRSEFAAFAAAIRWQEPFRNTPVETLQDVAVVEALLEATQTGRCVAPARIVPQ